MTDAQFEHWWFELVSELDLKDRPQLSAPFRKMHAYEMQILKAAVQKVLQSTLGDK